MPVRMSTATATRQALLVLTDRGAGDYRREQKTSGDCAIANITRYNVFASLNALGPRVVKIVVVDIAAILEPTSTATTTSACARFDGHTLRARGLGRCPGGCGHLVRSGQHTRF